MSDADELLDLRLCSTLCLSYDGWFRAKCKNMGEVILKSLRGKFKR